MVPPGSLQQKTEFVPFILTTGFPFNSSFQAFIIYITPKASRLRSRRSQQKSDDSKVGRSSHRGRLCLSLSIADQFVCVLTN